MRATLPTIRLLLLTAMLHCGCGAATAPAPGPAGVRTIAVEPIDNRTGEALVIDDPGVLGRVLDVQLSTVPGLLRGDLRSALTARGFDVLAEPAHDAAVVTASSAGRRATIQGCMRLPGQQVQ
jgi:hypothetical protein